MREQKGSIQRFDDLFEDEFGSYLESAKQDPEFRAAFEDAGSRHGLLDSLIKLRSALKLTQKKVASRMHVKQPTVSEFEKESSDPRLSTVQRYARAVEARVLFIVEMPAVCDWVTPGTRAYSTTGGRVTASTRTNVSEGNIGRRWADANLNSQRDWALGG